MVKSFSALLTLLVVSAILASCSPGNIQKFVEELGPVQDFLEQHPNADIRILFWDSETTGINEETITEKCGQMIPLKSYWYVFVEEKGTSLSLWIDSETRQPSCVFRKGAEQLEPQFPNEPIMVEPKEPGEDGSPVKPHIGKIVLQDLTWQSQPGPEGFGIYVLCIKGEKTLDGMYSVLVDDEPMRDGFLKPLTNLGCPSTGFVISCNKCPIRSLWDSHTVTVTGSDGVSGKKDYDFSVINGFTEGPVEPVSPLKEFDLSLESVNGYFDYGPAGFRGYVMCFDVSEDVEVDSLGFEIRVDDDAYPHTGEGIGRYYSICKGKNSIGLTCPDCRLKESTKDRQVVLKATKGKQEESDMKTLTFFKEQLNENPENEFLDEFNNIDGWSVEGPDGLSYRLPQVNEGVISGNGMGYSAALQPWPTIFKEIEINGEDGFELEVKAKSESDSPNSAEVWLYSGQDAYFFRVYGESSNYMLDWYTQFADKREKKYRHYTGPGVLNAWHTYRLVRDDEGDYELFMDGGKVDGFSPPREKSLAKFDTIGVIVAREGSSIDYVKLKESD